MRVLKINTLKSVKEQPWIDRDYILFHACFQIFEDFVEKEDGIEQWWENPAVPILQELYNWWQKEKFNCESDEAQEKLELLIKHRRLLYV